MDPSRKRLPAATFLLLLLVVATEMGAPVQAGDCLVFNAKWCGPCLKWRECADACVRRNEGFTGGRCRGFLPPYCFCKKPC
ncbi:defensin Ec-AMP-D2-like [Panicum miliaceum]|uniref:Defensin Ec-AMP-D2-like n=1 Tax=Panicum miliaceum TaxID=4540 RepID=A0A3L6QD34_PANMI|nr:defensin Ec-AMP-D2-like [Panicum miliaceum]